MKSLLLIGCSLSLLGMATPVHAQDTAGADNDTGLGEVVVTAQRRSENLQRAPIAVSAVTSDTLESNGVVAPQDLTRLVPSLNIASLSGGSIQVNTRGVGSFAGNAQTEAGVSISYDGVYISRPQATGSLFFDLERVEVLKGPQGTLYGRNSTAGAVNLITNKPNFDGYSVDTLLDIGNYNLVHGSIAANMPLSDTLVLRIAADSVNRDGYLSDGYLDDEHWGARAQVLWNPNDRWSVLVSADYAEVSGQGSGDVPSPFLNPSDPYQGPSDGALNTILGSIGPGLPLIGTDGYLDNTAWGLSSTIVYDPGDVTLTFIPAYRSTEVDNFHYGAGWPVAETIDSEATSFEVRLASDTDGPWQWLVGGYYFDESTPYALYFNQGSFIAEATNNLEALDTTATAVFAQATYALTPSLRLTAGARYSEEEKTQQGTLEAVVPFPGNLPITGDVSFDQTTWKVGIDFDLAENSLLYFNVGTGFKAGGFFNSLPPNTFEPEELTAYTLGVKNRFLDDTLQLNLEAFYWEYEGKQISRVGPVLPAGFNLVTDNAGSATLYGFEADVIWQATASDRFSATIQNVQSEYDSFVYDSFDFGGPPATGCAVSGPAAGFYTVDCSGRPLSFSPEWIVNVGYEHAFDFSNGASLVANVSARYESSSYVGDEFLPGQYQEENTISNASLTWNSPDQDWSLAAYVNNIEDEAVAAGSFVQTVIGVPLVVLRPPRTYGVRITKSF